MFFAHGRCAFPDFSMSSIAFVTTTSQRVHFISGVKCSGPDEFANLLPNGCQS